MSSKNKPFFVGYLDTPKELKKFYIPVVAVLGIIALAAGASMAKLQQSAGPAFWQNSTTATYVGLLRLEPYPVLHRINPENGDELESILLVNQGKYSSQNYAEPFKDKMVSVTGYPIVRGGWNMLELIAEEPIKSDEASTESVSTPLNNLVADSDSVSLGPITISGEIADSKCFLGVMNPGKGSVHKACAEVCLLGGIPAMLLVWGDDGQKYGYMLTQSDGSSISKEISIRAADYVEITGELQQKGDLLYIQISENGIKG